MFGSTLSRCGQFAAALLLGVPLFAGPTLTYNKVLYLNKKPLPVSLPFVITAKGVDPRLLPPQTEPGLADTAATAASATKVAFTWQRDDDGVHAADADTRDLRFSIAISAFNKADDSKPREAELKLGSTTLKVPYSIATGAPPGGGAAADSKTPWSALPIADPWVLSGFDTAQQCASVLVNAGSDAATGVTLGHSTLLEDTSHKPLTREDLRVCKDSCTTSAPFDLPANRPVPLSLCVLNRTRPGVFKGNIYLSAENRPDTLTIPLDIQQSLFWYKLAGLLCLIAGVVLAIIVIPMTRAAGTRDQQLLLAARRRPAATSLLAELQDLPPPSRVLPVSTRAALKTVLDSLSANALDSRNFLPPDQAGPLSPTVDSAGYTKFLAAIDAEIANLSQIVNQGVLVAAKQTAPEDQIATAITAIDALSVTADSAGPKDIEAGIAKALADAGIVAVSALKGVASITAGLATKARTIKAHQDKTTGEIESDLRRRQFWLNAFVVLFTVATGVLVLIVPKPGFGLTQDYIYCFFWGIGLPAAGQQLTPASVKAAVLGA